jgi:hypothetical protein
MRHAASWQTWAGRLLGPDLILAPGVSLSARLPLKAANGGTRDLGLLICVSKLG